MFRHEGFELGVQHRYFFVDFKSHRHSSFWVVRVSLTPTILMESVIQGLLSRCRTSICHSPTPFSSALSSLSHHLLCSS